MKKKQEKRKTSKTLKKEYDRRQVFVKITAGVLVFLMMAGTGVTLVYSLMA